MPVSPDFVAQITAALEAARPVQIKKMFGGLGIYLGDAFFGVADDDRLFFKVDAETLAKYEAKGMGPWIMPQGVNNKYREVPADIVANPAELGAWIDESARVAGPGKRRSRR